VAAGKKKGAAKKKPAAKKPQAKPRKKAAKKPPKPGGSAARKNRNSGKSKPTKSRGKGKQPRLTAAKQSVRDTLLMVRVDAQGWSVQDAAAEAGIGYEAARKALKKKREAQEPLLDEDPVKIVESLVRQWQAAIGDFEHMAVAALETNHMNAAVGAKKGAGEARQRLTELLQSFGTLPNDLGTLTYTIEIRAIALKLNAIIGDFFSAFEDLKIPKGEREKVAVLVASTVKEIDAIATKPEHVTPEPDEEEEPHG